MTGSANIVRNIGFCSAPTCCHVKPIRVTPTTSSTVNARSCHWPGDRDGDARKVNAMWIPPSASRPQLAVAIFPWNPPANQGNARGDQNGER